ncbi:MAG: hypothetical protein GY699_23655 [Desulfobacteraceae bacterium]|nr:hypothetical protein [Desulfobacteraceae bacterium]
MKTIIIIVLCFCLTGFSCATKQQSFSYEDIEDDKKIVNRLALEIADLISQEKNVNTTINFINDSDSVLGDKVLTHLKTRGFPLSETDGVKVSFMAYRYDSNQIYLSITLGKTILSRIFIYEVQTGTLSVGSPLNKGEV